MIFRKCKTLILGVVARRSTVFSSVASWIRSSSVGDVKADGVGVTYNVPPVFLFSFVSLSILSQVRMIINTTMGFLLCILPRVNTVINR